MADMIDSEKRSLVDQDGNAAVLDYAPGFGVFHHNGVAYQDAQCLCKVITTASGTGGHFIGPYLPETSENIVGHCEFRHHTHGWVANSGTLSVADGKLKFTPDKNAKNASCSLVLRDSDGCAAKAYRVRMRIRRDDTADEAVMIASSQGDLDSGIKGQRINTDSLTDSIACFSASGIPGHDCIGVRNTSGDADGKSFLIEDIDVRHVVPFAGWNSGGFSLLLDFTTPLGTPIQDQVIWQAGIESQRDKIQVLRGADKILKVIVTANNHEQANLHLGAIENNTRARLGVSLGTGAYAGDSTGAQQQFTACLNGESPVNSPAGKKQLPGPSHIWMKRGFAAGQEFPGKLHRASVIASQQSQEYMQYLSSAGQTNQVLLAGDSYTDGTCDAVLGKMLATALGRTVINMSVAGSTMTQIRDIVKTIPWAREMTWVIWGGRANRYGSAKEYCAVIAEIYQFIGHDRIVFLPPVSVGPCKGASAATDASDTLSIYHRLVADGRITFNPQAVLANAIPASDPQDKLDDAAMIIRASCLLDGIHLAAKPMSHIADEIQSVLASREI